jgi:hypothetical protein
MTEQSDNVSLWVQPTFEVISLSMECTAYAATLAETDQA